jgi:hypothetical protein
MAIHWLTLSARARSEKHPISSQPGVEMHTICERAGAGTNEPVQVEMMDAAGKR